MVGQNRLFNFGMATSLENGKLNSNLLNFTLKIDLALHPAQMEGLVNTYTHAE